ncbi:MAG: histidine phosphatase family protein [Acidimicrobiales bacterium]
MELILIRHGRPERIDHDPSGADPALTELGHLQAKAMAEYLQRESIDSLYVSPQLRALETAAPLADMTGLEPIVVDGVAEFDLGHTSYVPGEEAPPISAAALQQLLDTVTGPHFSERVIGSLEWIIEQNAGSTAAVVCHGGVISRYLSEILITDPSTYYDAAYTSVTRVRASRTGRRSMTSFNESHWLRSL